MGYGVQYDPQATLRGFQSVSEIQDAGITRRMRMLQLAQAQKEWDDRQKMDAAAQASVTNVPQRSYAPPQQNLQLGGYAPAPDANGVSIPQGGYDLAMPGSQASNPAHSEFDSQGYSGRLRAIDPLIAQNYDQQQAALQQKQQDAQLERQQKLVQLQNGLADLDTKDRASADAKRKQIHEVNQKSAALAWMLKNAAPEEKPQVYGYVRNAALQDPSLASFVQQMPEQYSPQIEPQLDQIITNSLDIDKIINAGKDTQQLGSGPNGPGVYSLNPLTGKHDRFEGKLPKTVAPGINLNMAGGSATDAKDIAAAIMAGDQAPTVKGLYRQGAAVRAELARQGFNLAQAESDWNATQKHLATLNSSQQERLRQAVQFTYDSTDVIENLYNEWKQVAGVSGFKVLNKANLALMKQLPGHAGEVATALEAQINDLTSELGTVYKGGNGSTDETLRLAGANLKADWNDQTFHRTLGLIRTNLGIRRNSIINSQPAGVGANNPYAGGGNQPPGGLKIIRDAQGNITGVE